MSNHYVDSISEAAGSIQRQGDPLRDPAPDRLPPHSPEAEQGVLGCCLLAPLECIDDCQTRFTGAGAEFYDLRHRKIYEVLSAMHKAGEAIDVITMQARLKNENILEEVGGIAYLSALPDTVPSSANLSFYLDIVVEKYRMRKLVRTCVETVEQVYACEGDAQTLIGKVQNTFYDLHTDPQDTADGKQCATALVDDLQRRFDQHHSGNRSGLVTGFHHFDALTDGLQFGELTIIAARPSIGKTAIGLNILRRVCLMDEIPAAFVTLEMGKAALMRRALSDWASIPMNALRDGSFTEEQFGAFGAFTTLVKERPLHIIDGVKGMNIEQVSASLRRLVRKHGIKLAVLDYLQRVKPSVRNEKRTYEVGEVSSTLKALADQLKIALLVLCRVNRESEKEKTNNPDKPAKAPKLSDLSDSGQIEYDGDTVCLLHRQRKGPFQNEADLGIAKQRDGELGVVHLSFNGQFCRFENPSISAPTEQQ